MPNESTAIHNLLDGLSRKAIPDDPDDDVLFAGSRTGPRKSAGRAAGMFAMPPQPPSLPGVAPFVPPAAPAPSPRTAHGTQHPPYGMVPATRTSETAQPDVWPLPVHAASSYPVAPLSAHPSYHSTSRVTKSSRWVVSNKKLYILPAALGTLALVLAGVILVRGEAGSGAAASTVSMTSAPTVVQLTPQAAAPAAVPQADRSTDAVVPPPPPPPPPPVVPASAFAARADATMPTVAPAATPAPVKAIASNAKPKRPLARDRHESKRAATKHVSSSRPTRVAAAPVAPKSEDLAGNGALAITSGSPREVWVDGRNSKRSTPLRVLLKPGKHTVTLFDKEHGTAKSFDVEIKANATLQVAK